MMNRQPPSRVLGMFCAAVAALLLSACQPEPQDTKPGQPVATRQKLFKAMLREFEPMGVMLREGPFDAARFEGHFRRFLDLAEKPWPYFREDTCYPPAKVKPQTCTDLAGIERRKEAFLGAVAGLNTAVKKELGTLAPQGSAKAETQARAALKAAYDRVYDTCQDCHRDYRKK
ncbi:hypothetical protein JCM10831_02710 [Hydrogenophilus hirschii]